MAFDAPINTNDQSVDRILATGLPVALVFMDGQTSTQLKHALEKQAAANAGKLLIAQVRPKDSPETAQRYQIRSLPALVTIQKGRELTHAESISPEELNRHIAYLLGQGPKPEPASKQTTQAPGSRTTPGWTTAQPGPRRAPGTGQGSSPQPVTDANFDQVVMSSTQPVLVDFWAPWCGPCRMTEPAVERLSKELSGKLVVAKINVDENPGTAGRFGIQSIPTMMLVKNGQIIDRWVGALPEPAIRSRVAAVVK